MSDFGFPVVSLAIHIFHQPVFLHTFEPGGGGFRFDAHLSGFLQERGPCEFFLHTAYQRIPVGIAAACHFGLGQEGEDVGGVHSISAADLAKIMSYCVLRSPKAAEFLAITQMPAYSFSDAEGKENFSCSNHNAFLQMMDGAISGKTGFTGDAGYCYVGALQSEDRTFVVALLACGWPNNKNYKWTDTRKLMEYGMAHYRYDEVWKIPELSKIPVENGVSQNGLFGKAAVEVEIKGKESPGKILVGDDDVAEEKTEVPEKLDAPVKSGTPVGQITYLLNGEKWGSCQAVVKETVRRRTFTWIAMKMCEMFYQFNF